MELPVLDPALEHLRLHLDSLRIQEAKAIKDLPRKLEHLFGMSRLFPDQYMYVVNYAEMKVVHARGFDNVLGFCDALVDLDLLFSLWHPEDAPTMARLTECATDVMFEVDPPLQPFEISLLVDYRMRTATGRYLKILRQTSVFEVDEGTGRPLSTVSICRDISSIKTSDQIGWQCTGRGADLLHRKMRTQEPSSQGYCPTHREMEVLHKLMEGKGSKLIAEELGIKFNTVNTHRSNLLERTGAKNTAELVRRAVEQGWA